MFVKNYYYCQIPYCRHTRPNEWSRGAVCGFLVLTLSVIRGSGGLSSCLAGVPQDLSQLLSLSLSVVCSLIIRYWKLFSAIKLAIKNSNETVWRFQTLNYLLIGKWTQVFKILNHFTLLFNIKAIYRWIGACYLQIMEFFIIIFNCNGSMFNINKI
jgi:hypothetical protein